MNPKPTVRIHELPPEKGARIPFSRLKIIDVFNQQLLYKIPVSYPEEDKVLTVDYYTPPTGWVYDYLEGKWVKTGVHKRSPISKECYWEIDPRFREYKKWRAEELKEKKTNPDYAHPALSQFIKDCWRNRLSGYWFNNNGVPTYITGAYWFMISVFEIDTGYPPRYNESQANLFYHWELVKQNPNCHGLLIITQRRGLKTYSGACIGVEETTRTMNFVAGIQSKNEKDAFNIYNKHCFYPLRKVPYFLLPEKINLPKGNKAPASGLKFNSGDFTTDEDELMSLLDFRSAEISAYDGYKLHFYYADEVGKDCDVDIYKRWTTVRKSLEDENRNIIGKSFQTTTVEELTDSSLRFLKLWRDSNQFDQPITKSGLHKHFVPAHMMQNVDKYGKVDVERNKQIILDRRAKFKGDPFELSKATRQDPLNEREAFMIDAMNCRFNPILLGDRISDLSFTDTKYKVGNFYWENGLYSTVKFVENPNGRVMILEHPTTPNQVTERGNYYFPNNRENYCMGSDSFDHKLLTKSSERSFSLGSFTVLKKPDPLNPTPLDYAVVCFYLHRPDSPDIYYDDNLMAAWYYGCENLIETQKIGIIKHYETLRCDGFVPYFVNNRRGIPATRESNEYIGVITDQYINNYIDRVFFIQLCKQWERFKPEDTTEFDGAMSFGYAYMLLKNDYKKLQQSVQPQATEIGDILSLYRSRSFTKNYRGF